MAFYDEVTFLFKESEKCFVCGLIDKTWVLRSGFSLLWQAKIGIIMGFGLNLVACLNLAVLCAWGEVF